MTVDAPNATQRRILEALGTYRLLNAKQMVRVGAADSEAKIRLEARVLERKGLIGQSEPHLVSGVTTLPRLHWLTDTGAEVLATGDPENDPLGARREMGDAAQIMHRIKTVEVHIALRLWAASADRELAWFVTDFEPGSGGRQRPTTIEYRGEHGPRFTPDAIANVIGPDGLPRLLVLEVERGRRDAKRLTEFKAKLKQLREVSAENVVEGWAKRPLHQARFLVVFATANMRARAIAAWPDPENDVWRNFFLKSDDELADFNAGWWRPDGRTQRPLFSFDPPAQPETKLPLPAV